MSGHAGLPKLGAALTFAEIGARLGCSEAAAKETFHYAVSKLRRQTPNALLLLLVYAKELERVRKQKRVA